MHLTAGVWVFLQCSWSTGKTSGNINVKIICSSRFKRLCDIKCQNAIFSTFFPNLCEKPLYLSLSFGSVFVNTCVFPLLSAHLISRANHRVNCSYLLISYSKGGGLILTGRIFTIQRTVSLNKATESAKSRLFTFSRVTRKIRTHHSVLFYLVRESCHCSWGLCK